MTWVEQQVGVYQRPLGENEKFIKLIGDRAHALGREHWSVTSRATFSLSRPLGEQELARFCRNAWVATRFEHPSIASEANETLLTYEVPNEKNLETWVNETLIVHNEQIGVSDLIASFKPSKYVTAHVLVAESTLLLHFPHWRTDGYGSLYLIDSFMRNLSSAAAWAGSEPNHFAWGQEVGRLVPGVEDALGLPVEPMAEIVDSAKRYLATAGLIRGAVGLKPCDGTSPGTLPQGTRHTNSRFTETETQTIQDACRHHDIDVVAAVQASCAAVTYAGCANDAKERPYTSTIRLSLRPFMPAPYSGSAYAAGICTGGFFEQVPSSQSWLDNAKQYTKAYKTGVTPDFLQTRRQYAKEVLTMMQQVPAPPPPVSSEIDISSVSDADQLVSARHEVNGKTVLEVTSIGLGVETLSRQVYCFLWTFRGQTEISLVWNEAFYNSAYMKQTIADIKKVLLDNLDII